MQGMATKIPQMPPRVSSKDLALASEQRTNKNMELLQAKGGMFGGEPTTLQPTGNPESDKNALAAATLMKKMDQVLAAQTTGGRTRRRRKRRNRTRKYIKVNYVRRRR